MKTSQRLIVAIIVFVALFAWYMIASDYGDGVTSGTYRLEQNGETSTLILNPDHTFHQEVNHSGEVHSAVGTWRRIGEGGVAFSKDFLVLPGQEAGQDGTSYGEIEKPFGVLVRLRLTQYHILWYGGTESSRDDLIAGTYQGNFGGIPATLVMNTNHTFEQTVGGREISAQARGTWKTRPNGDIEFSKEFLKTSGLALAQNETATALNPRSSGLQIEIAVDPKLSAPTYRKRQFLWQ